MIAQDAVAHVAIIGSIYGTVVSNAQDDRKPALYGGSKPVSRCRASSEFQQRTGLDAVPRQPRRCSV
jgi:hypothetical protein